MPPALGQKELIVNPISVMTVAVEHFYTSTRVIESHLTTISLKIIPQRNAIAISGMH